MLKPVLFKALATELGRRTHVRLPSVQMALPLPERGNEATRDTWQGKGMGSYVCSGETGTVRRQLSWLRGHCRELSAQPRGLPGHRVGAHGLGAAAARTVWDQRGHPRSHSKALSAPERLTQELV